MSGFIAAAGRLLIYDLKAVIGHLRLSEKKRDYLYYFYSNKKGFKKTLIKIHVKVDKMCML